MSSTDHLHSLINDPDATVVCGVTTDTLKQGKGHFDAPDTMEHIHVLTNTRQITEFKELLQQLTANQGAA